MIKKEHRHHMFDTLILDKKSNLRVNIIVTSSF